MQENGMETKWLEDGFEKAKDKKLLNIMVQDPMEYLQQEIISTQFSAKIDGKTADDLRIILIINLGTEFCGLPSASTQ